MRAGVRVGINGLGRIGRLALRAAFGAAHRPADDPRRDNRLQVVHLNELKGGAAAAAHLLAFDTVQGRWREDIAAEAEDAIRIGTHTLGFSGHADPGRIPWDPPVLPLFPCLAFRAESSGHRFWQESGKKSKTIKKREYS